MADDPIKYRIAPTTEDGSPGPMSTWLLEVHDTRKEAEVALADLDASEDYQIIETR